MKHIAIALGIISIVAFSSYSCAIYYSEIERQETARMEICIKGGGKWTTAWNWRAYCEAR